jgi:hypothetical protein
LQINQLSSIGGSKLGSIVQRILTRLISNEASKHITLTGRGKTPKSCLAGTKLLGVITSKSFI